MRSNPQSAPPNFGALSATAANTTDRSSEGTPNRMTNRPVASFMAESVSGAACQLRDRWQRGQQLAEHVELDGLHQVAIEAVSLGTEAIPVEAPAGDRDQRDVPAVRMLAHALGDLVAVHDRHGEVEEDDRGLELVECLERRGPIVRRPRLDAEQREQDRSEEHTSELQSLRHI